MEIKPWLVKRIQKKKSLVVFFLQFVYYIVTFDPFFDLGKLNVLFLNLYNFVCDISWFSFYNIVTERSTTELPRAVFTVYSALNATVNLKYFK